MIRAARAYFDRDVGELGLSESALLAGLIQAPGRLDPFHHPDAARARRDEILARMARARLIDPATLVRATAQPIALARPHPSYGTRVPWYTEQVRGLVAGALPGELARGGLTIETAALPALGTALQRDAVAHADRWGGAQVAALVWDHRTGYVEALVGGLDWDPDRFDRMMQSCRQPGSAWKPLVYGAALEAGAITPGTPLRDAPSAIGRSSVSAVVIPMRRASRMIGRAPTRSNTSIAGALSDAANASCTITTPRNRLPDFGFQCTFVASSYSAIGASRSAVPGVIAPVSSAAP